MTLTEAAYWTKRLGLVTGAIVLIIFVVLIIILNSSKDEIPDEYLTANYSCTDTADEFLENKLNLDSVKLKLGSGSDMLFQIETTSGQIDSLPSIVNVYAFEEQGQSINSQLEATTMAKSLGFDPDLIQRSDDDKTYTWTDTTRDRTLTVDAATLNFNLTTSSDHVREITEANESSLPSKTEAESYAVNTLKQANLLDDDYSNDLSIRKTYYVDVNPDGSYSEAASSGEADLIRVDFHRRKSIISILETIENADEMKASLEKKILDEDSVLTESEENVVVGEEKVAMYTFSTYVLNDNPYKPNISVYIGRKENDVDNLEYVYRIDYINWPIEEYPCGTYKLIAPSDAIQQIQDGNGYLTSLILKNGDHIEDYQVKNVTKFVVYDIYIAYYEGSAYEKFLQPIYVVEGEAYLDTGEKAEFVYYVPAVNYDLVTNPVVDTSSGTSESSTEVLDSLN